MWMLVAANLMNRMGAMVVAFLPLYLDSHEKLDIIKAGYVLMAFGVGSIIGTYIGGRMSDKLGFNTTMVSSLVLSAIVLISMGYVHGFYPLMAATFMLSLTADIFRPANSSAAIAYSSKETFTRSMSLLRMAFNLGWAVCPAIGGVLIYNFGWQITFWVDGITCIAAAGMLLAMKKPSQNAELEIPQEMTKEELVPIYEKSAYTDRRFLAFTFLTFVNAFVFMQILWTLPVYFKTLLGYNESQVGLLMALNGVIVFLVEMPLIYKIEKRRSSLYWVQWGLLMYAASFLVLLAPIGALFVSLACVIGLSFGEIFVMPFSSSYVSRSAPASRQGEYMALYSMAYGLANVLAPLVGTQIIGHFGYPYLWGMVGLLALVDWAGFSALRRISE